VAVFDKDWVPYTFFGTAGRLLVGGIQATCDMWSKSGVRTARLDDIWSVTSVENARHDSSAWGSGGRGRGRGGGQNV
jgi:hypothetical protein